MARKRGHWKIDDEEESFAEEEEDDGSSMTSRSKSNVPATAPGSIDTLTSSSEPLTVENSANEPALKALREAYGDLTAKIHSSLLLEHLLSSELLTEVEYETAKSKESGYDKNTEVLSAMRRRTQKEIVQFCQLLFKCNQSNCGRILLAALTNHGVDVSSITQPSPKPPVIRSSSPKYYPEMSDLKSRFITLVREVKCLARQVDVEDLKTICIELLNDVTSTKRNVQEDINALMKCSDGDYIAYLQLHWDPLDCELLFQLIRQLQKPELVTDWERYKVEVKEACKVTLAEARRSLPQRRELPVHQISAGFQTDQPSHDVTIQKILDLRDFLKKMMGLEEADFEGFDNVDVTLFYTVNRIRLPFLVRLFALHRRSLQEFSITVVFVPGEFIYNVTTDQEFAYPKLVSQAEASYQMKDLKEEMLHQFQELKSSKLSEEETKTQHLQNEAISLRFKLKEEEMLRKKVEEDRTKLTEELLKMQTEKKELVDEKKELQTEKKKLQTEKQTLVAEKQELVDEKKELVDEKKELVAEKKELVAEKNQLAVKNEELTEKLLISQSLQSSQSVMSKKESVMSSVLPEKMMSEVGTLLEQESSSLEDLQDKLKILLGEWSKTTESSKQGPPVRGEEIQELQKTMMTQFESVQQTIVKNLVEKLGCEENKTLVAELSVVLSKEVRPLRESFKEVYSTVFTPQIQQQKKEAIQILKELFDKGQGKMFQSDKIDASNLRSVKTPDMPIPTIDATAVLIGRGVFLAGGLTADVRTAQLVQVFNVSTGQWTTLPPAPQYYSEATVIDNKLVLIGGWDSSNEETTNMVSTWMVDEEKWVQRIPPMNMKRVRPGVLLLNKSLFVFGGLDEDDTAILNSFEVLDTERNQWSSGRGLLPQPLWSLKIGRYGDTVVLTSALDTSTTSTTKAWKIPVRVLEESVSNPSSQPIQWTPIADTPYYASSLLTNSKQPVLVGGFRGRQPTRNIYAFRSDQWDLVGELSEQCTRPAVLAISDSSFLVFGGRTDPFNPRQSLLNSVELITYSV